MTREHLPPESLPRPSQPNRLLVVGVLLGVPALALPWWRYSYRENSEFYGPAIHEGWIRGSSGWGVVFVLAWIVCLALVAFRMSPLGRLRDRGLWLADWFILAACAGLMDVSAVASWDRMVVGRFVGAELLAHETVNGRVVHAGTTDLTLGIGVGFLFAVVTAALLLVGAFRLRRERRKFKELD